MRNASQQGAGVMDLVPGLAPSYVETYGVAYLADSLEVMRCMPDASVNLVLTSPPFALTRKKEYGNKSSEEYVEWFLPFAREIRRILKDDGSFVLDLGGAYLPGHPVRSIYQYELLVRLHNDADLGFHLAQEFFHYNPSRLPAPAEWVNVRRIRVKDSVNVVWWLSKTEHPKADNRRILQPYSESMLQLFENGYNAKLRPSGWDISDKFSRNNGGAIPPNVVQDAEEDGDSPTHLLELANTESNSAYLRRCKAAQVKPHPARFPQGFARFFISFLTDEHDLVFEPFAGSNTTGYVAEHMRRRWIAVEISDAYLAASRFRFTGPDVAPTPRKRARTRRTAKSTEETLWRAEVGNG